MASASTHLTGRNSKWREFIQEHFPDALSVTYTVPPVHLNRVPYTLDTVPGTSREVLTVGTHPRVPGQAPPAKRKRRNPPASRHPPLSPPKVMFPEELTVPTLVQESDFRDDAAQARVIRNLEELGRQRQEAMFVLSQFRLINYLNKPEHQAAVSRLPRPSQLGPNFSQGDFDVLVIHRRYGALIGEMKSVGHNRSVLSLSEADSDAVVVKRVQGSLTQLRRLETVMRHLLHDVAPHLTIRTTVFLPNVSRAELLRILVANSQLEQDVCQTLGAVDGRGATNLCCCEDDMSARDAWWEVTPAVLTNLTKWWESRMDSEDQAMTDEVYLDIVARFVGPASSISVDSSTQDRAVEVKKLSQAVREVGWRLSQLVFTPPQLELISRQLPLVYLNGPPGTGKTVVLVMVGVGWVEKQIDTYVVSLYPASLAITTLIANQIQHTARPAQVGAVYVRHYDFDNEASSAVRALRELSAAARSGAGLILDEVNFDTSDAFGQRTYDLIQKLVAREPALRLWCAGLYYKSPPPAGLQVQAMGTPLRSAPVVLREVRPALAKVTTEMHDYLTTDLPAPGDGPAVRRLRHSGDTHVGRWPVECWQCGKDVAAELRRLGVGVPGSGVKYRDVFLLTRSTELDEEIKDDAGEVTSQACGVVRGVRDEGMPVRVLGKEELDRDEASWRGKLEDAATATTDCITAADRAYVTGLERKVVVWLQGRVQGDDERRSDEVIDVIDRLHLVTRCTTQLVVVDAPPTAAAAPPGADDETTTARGDNSHAAGTGDDIDTHAATPPTPATATLSTPTDNNHGTGQQP